ncbi:methionyl-tRNA formyltransferase [Burkholderiales bacterium JOSHI_001]|nr:methionyl-tRNA formyltransferase [Burkholderiales bacterium JOSHI_001]
MRIGFAGTPEFAAAALQRLLAEGFDIGLVLTQPDRPAGRGLKLQPSAVKALALQHGLALAQPRSLRLDGKYPEDARAALAALQDARLDALVVAAYGLILPRWVLELPRLGCLNIHGSLLPRWRGAAPIHRAIEAGDGRTGITIMQMDEGLDTGDMLLVKDIAIAPDDSTATLHDKLAALGAELIVPALRQAQAGSLVRTRQPEAGVTYAHKIEKSEAGIDWRQDARQIERRLRAFDPFPGAHFQLGAEAIKLWRALVVPDVAAAPGTVVAHPAHPLVIACGEGGLAPMELQRPGGKRLPVAAFVAAQPPAAGQVLAHPAR